jgi:hypothetical protein
MNAMRMPLAVVGLFAVLELTGCQRAQRTSDVLAELNLDNLEALVTGPYAHENLAVFLIHTDRQDERDFLTLDEGLRKELVKITEMDQEQVGALQLENESDLPLYLQEGERLRGGKQDRTIIASLVVPPHSGKTTVPTFCIERSRWEEGKSGKEFGYTASLALAPKAVRGAAKVDDTQEGVWVAVMSQKVTARDKFKAANTNSSANEMLDAPQVRKISEEYGTALDSALEEQPSAVGVAIVVNGGIEEVNVYPNHQLLKKMFPRLVRSYAVQAAMLKDQPTDTSVSSADVARFMRGGQEAAKRDKNLGYGNDASIRELADNCYECTTRNGGKVVHWQMLKRNGAAAKIHGHAEAAAKRGAFLGNDW